MNGRQVKLVSGHIDNQTREFNPCMSMPVIPVEIAFLFCRIISLLNLGFNSFETQHFGEKQTAGLACPTTCRHRDRSAF